MLPNAETPLNLILKLAQVKTRRVGVSFAEWINSVGCGKRFWKEV